MTVMLHDRIVTKVSHKKMPFDKWRKGFNLTLLLRVSHKTVPAFEIGFGQRKIEANCLSLSCLSTE